MDKRHKIAGLTQPNPLGNPLRLLNNAGGNFDGVDQVIRTAPASFGTCGGNAIFQFNRKFASYPSLIKHIGVDLFGAQIFINPSDGLVLTCWTATDRYDTLPLTLEVGGNYNIQWTVNKASPTGLKLIVNGVTQSFVNTSSTAPLTNFIGFNTGGVAGNGLKLSYVKMYQDAIQVPIYAPSLYGVYGSTDIGKGWLLTDGSPATFWANYGQDFPLLTQAGGTFSGIDSCALPTPTTITDGTVNVQAIYRHDRIANTDAFRIIRVIGNDSKGVMVFINAGSHDLLARSYDGTNYWFTTWITLTVGSAYQISVVGNSFSNLVATVNGVSYTLAPQGPSVTAGSVLIGSSVDLGTGKVSSVYGSVGSFNVPEYNPSTYGTFGTSDAGNGWVLTDSSPLTFWS